MSFVFRAALLAAAVAAPLRAAAPPAEVDPTAVAGLLRRLDADGFHTRQRADAALRRLGRPTLPLLRQELARTRSLEVRSRLKRIIHDLTFVERVPELLSLLAHDNTQFRDRAEAALRQGGPKVVPLLRQQNGVLLDAEGRRRLARIIAELERPGR